MARKRRGDRDGKKRGDNDAKKRGDHDVVKRRADRDVEKKRAAFLATQRKLARRRTVIGMLAFVPLLASLVCGTGTPLDALCVLPQEYWLLIWAALFGSFLGLTIRLVLDRRRFERGSQSGRPA